uniref:mirror-image polydactyly gene 1 protein-like n=1 Tax=Styela clava TaxID=7725 RepID=UPI00193A2DEA|nr:mirror-image polydactyly gene 1 protein-like [Styela clava]
MEGIEDYSGHADKVLSDLRDAVVNADDKLIQLQKELDSLERKALEKDHDYGHHNSKSSDLNDDDISKYLEDYSEENTIDDSILTSLRSSASLSYAAAATKPFETYQSQSKPAPAKSINQFSTPVENNKTNESHSNKSNEDEMNERWGCLRNVLAEDNSGPLSRDDMLKEVLQASTMKQTSPLKNRSDTPEKRSITMTSPRSSTPKYSFLYPELFKEREKQLNEARPERKSKDKFLHAEREHSQNDRFFKPIQHELLSSRSEESYVQPSHAEIEAKIENKRLQKLLEDEKKKNSKLTSKVSSLEKDLEELQCKIELKNHDQVTGKIAVIVEEIQKAQKLRENAMMERLNIAARDRDEALMRAKAMHMKNLHLQKKDTLNPHGSDKTIADIVDKITMADSATVIEKYGSKLIERINNLKNAKARITAEEMAVVMKERDDAIAKSHSLHQELQNCVEELNNLKKSQNTSVNTTLTAKVLSTQEECEQTQVKLSDAEEEIQMLRIYYSLHKSLTLAQDRELVERYHKYLGNIKEDAIKRSQQTKKVLSENHQLHESLEEGEKENQNLQNENSKLNQDLKYLREKCGKLERLVKVLRRKLISQTQAVLLNQGGTEEVQQKED